MTRNEIRLYLGLWCAVFLVVFATTASCGSAPADDDTSGCVEPYVVDSSGAFAPTSDVDDADYVRHPCAVVPRETVTPQ